MGKVQQELLAKFHWIYWKRLLDLWEKFNEIFWKSYTGICDWIYWKSSTEEIGNFPLYLSESSTGFIVKVLLLESSTKSMGKFHWLSWKVPLDLLESSIRAVGEVH